MWTKAFWKATAERMVRGGAGSMLSVLVVGDGVLNAFNANWENTLGVGAGGAVVALLLSLVGGVTSGDEPASPALLSPETIKR